MLESELIVVFSPQWQTELGFTGVSERFLVQ